MKQNDNDFAPPSSRGKWLNLILMLFVFGLGAMALWHFEIGKPVHADAASARAERRTFKNALRRQGFIHPLKEERIYSQLAGTILEIALEGTLAKKDDIVLTLDPLPHEDAKASQEEDIAVQAAEYKKLREASLKILNLAREDVNSYELRLELENLRLLEIKKGPTPTEEINAQVNWDNNKTLLKAKQEEAVAIEYLAKLNYASKEEWRQKELDVTEQQLKVVEMDIALRKLHIIDPVKVAQQELKVTTATKTRDAAKEKADILEKSIAREELRYNLRKEREESELKVLEANILKTTYRAPCPGVVVPRRFFRGFSYAPGREIFDGQEILTIPDLSQMKIKLTVDEGRIGSLTLGMAAAVIPAGWTGAPFKGVVGKISEQGRDEFELFTEDTTSISGTANRKVFEVDIELKDHSPVLRMGLRCDVEIILGQLENAVVIPRSAVMKQVDGSLAVNVLAEQKSAVLRRIKVISESDLWAAVEGIKEGERVLLAEAKPQ